VVSPLEIIEKRGADILRLWVCSNDFTQLGHFMEYP